MASKSWRTGEPVIVPDDGAVRPDVPPVPGAPRPDFGAPVVSGGRRRAPAKRSTFLGGVSEVGVVVAVALVLAVLIRTFLVQAFYVPSVSMTNTLEVNDRILVSKLSTHFGNISRGEVIVFKDPGGWLNGETVTGAHTWLKDALTFVGLLPTDTGEHLVKRVIGTQGDHVVCCDSKGRLTVNGVALEEAAYLYPGDNPSDTPFDITVPAGKLWVMGDHRGASADSRAHLFDPGGPFVPLGDVVGRAVVVVWPIERFRILSIPDAFATVPNGKTPAPSGFTPSAAPSGMTS